MYPIYYFKKLTKGPFLALLATLLVSCGTYNEDYYDSDGIYNDGQQVSETETPVDKTNYYKQYFQTKAAQYQDVPEEDVIFTDIEAYTTNEYLDDEGYIVTEERGYDEAYGGWGTNSDEVTINFYNDGFYGYNSFFWGYGWNRPFWGYNSWYSPFFHPGYGWSYPLVGPFSWGFPYYGYYGYGWGSPFYSWYHPHYFANGYYGNYAYNRGRRNTDYIGRNSLRRGTRDVNARNSRSYSRNSYSRSEMMRRNSNARRSYNAMRNNSSSVRRNNSRTIRSQRPAIRNSNNTSRRSSRMRPSSNRSSNMSRSNSSSVRSSGSSSRSSRSSSSRSSSGSSRRGGGR